MGMVYSKKFHLVYPARHALCLHDLTCKSIFSLLNIESIATCYQCCRVQMQAGRERIHSQYVTRTA